MSYNNPIIRENKTSGKNKVQNNFGPLTFGLDIGIASVGWAVLGENRIIDLGVRCFDKAETAKEGESLNLARRTARLMRRRLDVLVDELGLDRERMRLWGIAHALAWGVSGGGHVHDGHMRAARLLHDLRR